LVLDDGFSSIVRAVRLGRRIYDSIGRRRPGHPRADREHFAGPVLLGWPLVLCPSRDLGTHDRAPSRSRWSRRAVTLQRRPRSAAEAVRRR
jgi:hypothetical protein